ncbi:AbgT family transporter [Mangrovivirga sp. M17]|uniref:AbgT family transporter n=1 Tax=Mangrovivirga halotolerans TaxID=2993936 RepID=A0ABT3RQ35_9BACT|nr:TIGR00366 family protein [Mangrovivirga halotolerans]MCX2743484.1 AbgT family transporter [Mangrovivirga halotolerans]
MMKIRRVPDTLVIIFCFLILFTILTWIIPSGEYEKETITLSNGSEREVLIPGTYHYVEENPQGFLDFLMTPIKGFIGGSQIIGFILIVGGAFSVFNRTGAVTASLQSLVRFCEKHPTAKGVIIPLIIIFFSIMGATFGMSEEVLVFVLLTIPMAKSLGYDTITGIAIPFVGAGAGFAGAITNPFTIGIAQEIAEVPMFSGYEYRMVVWVVLTFLAVFYIMRYARKIYNPALVETGTESEVEQVSFTPIRKVTLFLLFGGLAIILLGVTRYGWYINEIAAVFFGMGLLSAVINRMNIQEAVDAFKTGAGDVLTAGLVVALSKGLLILAEDGKIIETILHGLASLAEGWPKAISVEMMFVVQSLLNFFLPSGSGQAVLTMPIMAPLSDLLGISRQTAVLAFQFGDGLSNLIIPTSAVTMGVLSIGKVPYEKWLKWMLPLFFIMVIASGILLLLPAIVFGWN